MDVQPPSPLARERKASPACLHCGQTLGDGAIAGFCCLGCRRVYELLKAAGLSRYYELRGSDKLAPVLEAKQTRDHLWLESMLGEGDSGPVRRFSLDVQGVQCTACVWLVDALFAREDDAYQCQLNPSLGRLDLRVGPRFDVRHFVESVERFGYLLGPSRKGQTAHRGLLLRTVICLALAGNAMFLASTTYVGLDSGPLYRLVQQASFVMATLSVLLGGSYFVERAWAGLRRGVLHLDLPIAVGMGLAYLGSVWSFWLGDARASYLDSLSVFVALMLVGRLLQERLVERNQRQLLASEGASALTTRRLRDGRAELTSCASLAVSDELLVCPGELVPVRTTMRDHHGACSLDWITGEPEPRRFRQGEEVPAGAVNASEHAFRVTVVAPFSRSDLDLLLRDDARASAALRGEFWDRLARIYVAGVLIATAVGVIVWLALGHSVASTLEVATAVLVVTCPCAFGIAAPLATELGVGALRKLGFFVRDASFFDRAAQVRRVVFDKTGTLTTGALTLQNEDVLSTLSASSLSVLYTLTAGNGHPKSSVVAQAIVALGSSARMGDEAVREIAGKGVELTRDGTVFRFGDAAWASLGACAGEGALCLAANGVVLASFEVVEQVRADAVREARALASDGYERWIASGDAPTRVRELGARLGVPAARAVGGLSPDAKLSLVEALDRRDTMFIGDGINDALALGRAHVSGTPAIDRPFVPSRADFYFLSPGLAPVRVALRAAHHVRRVITQALAFAVVYNVVAVAIAYAGLMRPWLAALLMPLSSAFVLGFTAFRLSPRRAVWKF